MEVGPVGLKGPGSKTWSPAGDLGTLLSPRSLAEGPGEPLCFYFLPSVYSHTTLNTPDLVYFLSSISNLSGTSFSGHWAALWKDRMGHPIQSGGLGRQQKKSASLRTSKEGSGQGSSPGDPHG